MAGSWGAARERAATKEAAVGKGDGDDRGGGEEGEEDRVGGGRVGVIVVASW